MEVESRPQTEDAPDRVRETLKTAGIMESKHIIEETYAGIRENDPHASTFEAMQALSYFIPRTTNERQQQIYEAITSNDRAMASAGKEVLLLSNTKTILSAIAPYVKNDQEENDEIIQSALTEGYSSLKSFDTGQPIPRQVYFAGRSGAIDYLRNKYDITEVMVRNATYMDMFKAIEEKLEHYPLGLSGNTKAQITDELSKKYELSNLTVLHHLQFREYIHSQNDEDFTEMIEDTVLNEQLASELEATLNQIRPRFKQVLELRYGLRDGKIHTHREIAELLQFTPQYIREVEKHALSHIAYVEHSRYITDTDQNLRKFAYEIF